MRERDLWECSGPGPSAREVARLRRLAGHREPGLLSLLVESKLESFKRGSSILQ